MNRSHTSSSRAFTLRELVVLIATVALIIVLAGLFLQDRTKARNRAVRINCISDLKNINLAFRIWSNDHNERFPWQVPEAEGGTLPNDTPIGSGFGSLGDVYSCLSNELNVPKVLVCAADSNRMRATTFETGGQPTFGALTRTGTLAPSKGRSSQHHLSYFAGMDADETRAQTVLCGDRNLVGAGAVQGMTVQDGILVGFTSSAREPEMLIEGRNVHWDRSIHNSAGNIGLADGSVHQTSSQQLSAFFAASCQQVTNSKTRILLPTP